VSAYEREQCVARFLPFKSSLHLLFFLLGPWSECLRIFLTCLRDDRLTIFVALALADRALAPGSSRLVSGYDIGTFERSNKPAQSLKERLQFIWIGKRYRTDIFRSFTVGSPTNDQPPILRIRRKKIVAPWPRIWISCVLLTQLSHGTSAEQGRQTGICS
jgi:hypothetical protein